MTVQTACKRGSARSANSEKRERKRATPAGFERPRNPVKPGDDRPSPTEGEKAEEVSPRLTGRSGSKVAKLALVAMNALRNGDLHRAVEVLQSIHDECLSESTAAAPVPVGSRADRS
jgi:hypothetical protein